MQNIIKLSVAVHEHKLFCPISQWWKIRKSCPVTLTLIFSGFRVVVKKH